MTHFIGGNWTEGSGAAFQSLDPATGETVWQGNEATEQEVEQAVTIARAAFESWGFLSLEQRVQHVREYAAALEQRKSEMAELISREAGKVSWDALGEAGAMVGKVEISIKAYEERTGTREAENGPIKSRLSHRPHGVMAVFGPYNFPGHLPNGHIVPGLIAGNTVVFKPSEQTPAVAELMVRIWDEAGLPKGVINLVQGGRSTGEALVGSRGIDGLLFTGSARTGQAIARQLVDRPEVIQALELGGNNPLIVHEVEDKEAAALLTINSAFISSGQRCTCARRLIVPVGAEGDAFIQTLVDMMARIRVGAWNDDPTPYMGPVISGAAATAAIAAYDDLVRAGGIVLKPLARLDRGDAFLTPGLVDVSVITTRPDEEIFGPLLQLVRVKDFEEAIAEANNTRFGLAAGLLSDNRQNYENFYPRARAGIVNWNQQLTGAASTAPFGGIGWSGNHRPSAYYAADYCSYAVASMDNSGGRVEIGALPQGLDTE
ncbi:N-succinylglutamate 5-semialdehyde dehydrogenase [Kordiimonas sediminis]|uniref:N-succinylglutamate 5-semialdehyde dehydrogenase n=1 Tax=Kordiimonas sediminis TaxID=1735581 RepID=A0A919AP18_9PROT|nr:succinylglutamate-semialdehyde dehydrogenase [Kordiimonas sediminis]GHF18697.1 N-succinylglutamate 5-semialdehyde dehydrogenase [Kordiimonas sediminis]